MEGVDVRHGRASGAVLCTAAMVAVGSSVAVSGVLTSYPVLAGQAGRYLLAGVLLLAAMRALGLPWIRPSVREFGYLCALAAVGLAGFNVLLVAAVGRADPAVIGSILGTAPVVMALTVAARLREWPAAHVLVGALVVTIGVALIEGAGRVSPVGLLLAVGVLACELAFSLLALPLLARLGPVRMSAYGCLLSVPMLAVAAALGPGPVLAVPSLSELAALVWLAIIVTAAAFVCWYSGLARLGAQGAGLFLGLVPVGALVTGLILGLVEPTIWGMIGCIVCTAGIAVGATNRSSSVET
jgi:drug/metabolite transporter (DMT)-like permease